MTFEAIKFLFDNTDPTIYVKAVIDAKWIEGNEKSCADEITLSFSRLNPFGNRGMLSNGGGLF
jgi:hypothetical protein